MFGLQYMYMYLISYSSHYYIWSKETVHEIRLNGSVHNATKLE